MEISSKGEKMIWNEKFEQVGKRGPKAWQDKIIINALRSSILLEGKKLTHDQINEYIGSHHGYSKRFNEHIPYPKVREIADLLGVPPWLLFSKHEENEVIEHMYQSVADPLHEYQISATSDLINRLEHLGEKRAPKGLNQELINNQINKLKKALTKIDWISNDHWDDILDRIESGIKENESYFDWAAHIVITKMNKEIYRATIRVDARIYREKNSGLKQMPIISIWLLVTRLEEGDIEEETSLIDKMKRDISLLIDRKNYWTIKSDDGKIGWYGWHTYRSESPPPNEIISAFKDKFSVYGGNGATIQAMGIHSLQYLFYPNSFKNQKSSSIVKENGLKTDRRFNPLRFLYIQGYIDEGSLIVIRYYKMNRTSLKIAGNENKCFAKIVVIDNDIKLKWEYDNQLYGLNELNNKIIDELGLSYSMKNGSDFWELENRNISLYDLAQSLLREETITEQMTIFDV